MSAQTPKRKTKVAIIYPKEDGAMKDMLRSELRTGEDIPTFKNFPNLAYVGPRSFLEDSDVANSSFNLHPFTGGADRAKRLRMADHVILWSKKPAFSDRCMLLALLEAARSIGEGKMVSAFCDEKSPPHSLRLPLQMDVHPYTTTPREALVIAGSSIQQNYTTVKAKYDSVCKGCGKKIVKDEEIVWSPGKPVYHPWCPPWLMDDEQVGISKEIFHAIRSHTQAVEEENKRLEIELRELRSRLK